MDIVMFEYSAYFNISRLLFRERPCEQRGKHLHNHAEKKHEQSLYPDGRNEFGCPLHAQTGHDAVKNFAQIIAHLPPELRAAFEAERQACQAELKAYIHMQF
jgi:hypothetical protein